MTCGCVKVLRLEGWKVERLKGWKVGKLVRRRSDGASTYSKIRRTGWRTRLMSGLGHK